VLSEHITAADRSLAQATERDPAAARLMEVPSVGPLTALTFVHTIEDPSRFRRLLVQFAYRILGPFGCDSSLRRWAQELASRGGPAGRERAVTALARNLAVVLHRLWVLEDLRQSFGEASQRRFVHTRWRRHR